MLENDFKLWLYLSASIAKNLPYNTPKECPRCGNKTIDFQYVGDLSDRIGYLDVWCTACLHGIHISRVRVPENANMITFDAPKEEIIKRIPSYIQVTP